MTWWMWLACTTPGERASAADPPSPPVASQATAPPEPPSPTPADAPPGCPLRVEDLPDSPVLDREDPRLRGRSVVVVLKEVRRSMLFTDGVVATGDDGRPLCWRVALANPYVPGHKVQRGDMRTPEGWWRTSDRPWSAFDHAITGHYPGTADAGRGLRSGWIDQAEHDAIVAAQAQGKAPPMDARLGGQILLHGGGSQSDWTLGCVAYDDEDILQLRARLPQDMGTDLLVLP